MMMDTKYIVGTKCPMCNQTLTEESIVGKNVVCSSCRYEYPLLSPLEKKRERTALKAWIEIIKQSIIIALVGYMIFLLPLALYVLLSEQTIANLFAMYPIGTTLYCMAAICPLTTIASLAIFNLCKKNNYDMEWLRTYLKKHVLYRLFINLKYLEKIVAESLKK